MDVLRQIRVDEVVTGVAVWAVCGSCLYHEPEGKSWWRIWHYSGRGGEWAGTVTVVLTLSLFYSSVVLTTSTDAN